MWGMAPALGAKYGIAVRVLVADMHANRRRALRVALFANPALRSVGEAADFEDLILQLEARQPDVLVVSDDLLLQGAALAYVHLQGLEDVVRTLVVTMSPFAKSAPPFLRNHLWGSLAYADVERHLLKAVLAIANGEMWLSRRELSAMVRERSGRVVIDEMERLRRLGLTSREIQIVQRLMRGRTNKEIGHELMISDLTVKTHVQNIFKKCGMRRRSELPVQMMAA
jgi:DNA-binding NarL/FixJ family response regulator